MDITIDYYNNNADKFIENTYKSDMSKTRNRFIKYLNKDDYILDLGCGSGRDTKAFLDKGFRVKAIDLSEEICSRTSKLIEYPIQCMDILEMDFKEEFHGIWACASLLHISNIHIDLAITNMLNSLKSYGYIYISVKKGNFQGVRDGRYFKDYSMNELVDLLSQYPVKIVDKWITKDSRPERNEDWLNIIIQKHK